MQRVKEGPNSRPRPDSLEATSDVEEQLKYIYIFLTNELQPTISRNVKNMKFLYTES